MSRKHLVIVLIAFSTSLGFAMSKKPAETPKSSPKVSGKSLGYFHTKMWTEDNGNGDLTLFARVVSRKEMNNSDFKWKLPEGARLISGEQEGQFSFSQGQDKIFSVVVDKASIKDKDQFFFFVYEMKNGEKHGASQNLIYSASDVSKGQLKGNTKKTPKYYE